MPASEFPNDEIFSAYLDGELSAQERKAFEQRLANEPELRAELLELQQLSGLFQSIPHQQLPNAFAERVLVAAEREMLIGVDAPRPIQSGSQPRWYWWLPLGLAATIAAVLLIPNWSPTRETADRDASESIEEEGSLMQPANEIEDVTLRIEPVPGPTIASDEESMQNASRGAEFGEAAAAPTPAAADLIAENDRKPLSALDGLGESMTRAPTQPSDLARITSNAPQGQFAIQIPPDDLTQQIVIHRQLQQNTIRAPGQDLNRQQQVLVVGNRSDVAALMRAFQDQGATVAYQPPQRRRGSRQQAVMSTAERDSIASMKKNRPKGMSETELDTMYGELIAKVQLYAVDGESKSPIDEVASNALLQDLLQSQDSRRRELGRQADPSITLQMNQEASPPLADADQGNELLAEDQLSLLLSFESIPAQSVPQEDRP